MEINVVINVVNVVNVVNDRLYCTRKVLKKRPGRLTNRCGGAFLSIGGTVKTAIPSHR